MRKRGLFAIIKCMVPFPRPVLPGCAVCPAQALTACTAVPAGLYVGTGQRMELILKDALSVFTAYLQQNSLKDTPQRRTVLNHFLETSGHYSAEEFYNCLQRKGENVGQATVYRTLRLLCNMGIAREVNFGDGITRFEVGWGNEHHDHLICELCNENLEVLDEDIEHLQNILAARYGYTLTSHRLYLYGICPRCRAKAQH